MSSEALRFRSRHRWIAGCLVAAMLAGGCSTSGTAVSTPFATTRAPALGDGPMWEVKAGTIHGLGQVLVDGQGITLYMYETDHRGSPSRCYGICAIQWPPLTLPTDIAAPVAGPGIDPRLLGTAPRTDGTAQITYNGWPLYLWPPDKSPGTATGQALTNAGGLWFVLDPAGNPVQTPLSG